jgi:hypothetical protein
MSEHTCAWTMDSSSEMGVFPPEERLSAPFPLKTLGGVMKDAVGDIFFLVFLISLMRRQWSGGGVLSSETVMGTAELVREHKPAETKLGVGLS